MKQGLRWLPLALCCAAALCLATPKAGEGVRPLNNVVRALPVVHRAQGKAVEAAFTVPDAGWLFVEFSAPVREMKLEHGGAVVADDAKLVAGREFMLDLPAGQYRVTALPRDNAPETDLRVTRVHRVPNIYYYAPAAVAGMEVLDGNDHWRQIGAQLLGCTNLLAPGTLKPEELAVYRKAGRRVFFNSVTRPLIDGKMDEFVASVSSRIGLEQWDGCTVDEFGFRNPLQYAKYGEALKRIGDLKGKCLYTWCYGVRFDDKPWQREFLKTLLNPPNGKGLMMTEVYLETKETEEEAEKFIRKRLVDDTASILRTLPEMAPCYGVVPGNFNSMPILTEETVPEADYKYYLDRQLQVIATDPSFKGLGLVGYWGGNYCHEELQRWCLLLLRHYFIDGSRELLSPRYGFRYHPGILENGDFLRDLSPWEAIPAEKGAIRHDAVKGHGYLMQRRWGKAPSARGGVHNGDEACVITRSAQGANVIRQTMRNLVPGRPYQLQYVVGCFDDAKNKVNAPREYGVRAVLDPALVEVRFSGVYVDRRPKNRQSADGLYSHANVHRVVFVPRATEVVLTLTDADSPEKPGTQLMVNFVQVKPYFAPEMMQ